MDARDFFKRSLQDLNDSDVRKKLASKAKVSTHRQSKRVKNQDSNTSNEYARTSELLPLQVSSEDLGIKKWFDHYVMNLPAAAVEFLGTY